MTIELSGKVIKTMIMEGENGILSTSKDSVKVTWAGFEGDQHAGVTMPSGGRQKKYFPRGTDIRNTRQVSILSVEELAEVAEEMDLDSVEAEWIGANLVLSGIPELTRLPPGTRLYFSGGVSIVVEEENFPCSLAAKSVQEQVPDVPEAGDRFIKAALHRRGLVAWVERPGTIRPGDTVSVSVPEQYVYQVEG
jgi:MOSC domain-containing protein YiiM